uniref:Uncharacterized protein n=1 Tax=Rhizophagus irregularis (strain DAOM 181602 / DAOM 197198 / MUCL 43194) TaxID=747089 RepID=U9U7G5_RHIID
MSLINSKKIGPEFAIKRHLEAIYTSRPLSDLISKCSSAYSSSNISFGGKQGLENNTVTKSSTIQNFSTPLDSNYISAELGLDIDTESSTSQDLNSVTQNFSTALDSNYISAELGLDIDTESLSSQNLSCTNQNFSTSLKKRRNEELLNVETHDNSGKYLSGSITIEASKIFRYSTNADYLEIFNVKKSVESR